MQRTVYDFDFDTTLENMRAKREAVVKAFIAYENALVDMVGEVDAFHKARQLELTANYDEELEDVTGEALDGLRRETDTKDNK